MEIAFGTLVFLVVALTIALGFECINGFHDTANAVATVIYTKSLKPQIAVLWSGFCNFLGVLLGGIAVAFSIVHLLPVDLLVKIDTGAGMAMVIALLLAAIIWNFGTWYMGIPVFQLAHADRRDHRRGPGQLLPARPLWLGSQLEEGGRGRPVAVDLAADRLRPGRRPAACCSRSLPQSRAARAARTATRRRRGGFAAS